MPSVGSFVNMPGALARGVEALETRCVSATIRGDGTSRGLSVSETPTHDTGDRWLGKLGASRTPRGAT